MPEEMSYGEQFLTAPTEDSLTGGLNDVFYYNSTGYDGTFPGPATNLLFRRVAWHSTTSESGPSSQVLARERSLNLGHIFRSSLGHNLAPVAAAARTKVNDPIGLGDQINIVLDDQH